jgi:hypothetical protein
MILSYNQAKKEKDLDTSLDSIKAEKINEIEELLSKQSKIFYLIFSKEDVEIKSNESSDEIFNKNFLDNDNNQNQKSVSANFSINNNNLELKDLFNISKEVSLSRGEEDFIQKDILQEIEKSPKKRLSNGSFKFEEKNDKSKDSKESNESGFIHNNKKNFILKSTLCQGENSNEFNKNHSFSFKGKENNNRFS